MLCQALILKAINVQVLGIGLDENSSFMRVSFSCCWLAVSLPLYERLHCVSKAFAGISCILPCTQACECVAQSRRRAGKARLVVRRDFTRWCDDMSMHPCAPWLSHEDACRERDLHRR